MSYQREREEFIGKAMGEGLTVDVCRKLLRYASTLQRLSEAQCNGDWPYNGDRDRPNAVESTCADCKGTGEMETGIGMFPCDTCHGNGKTWHRDAERDARHDRRYTVCPKCETGGVSKSAMRYSSELRTPNYEGDPYTPLRSKVCPDCRTQELVNELLDKQRLGGALGTRSFTAHFNGDPRGAVLVLSTPGYPWTEDGRERGLYVPAGKSR